jgi:hypothetical protein
MHNNLKDLADAYIGLARINEKTGKLILQFIMPTRG